MNEVYENCRRYLGWEEKNVTIKPLTGGLTNVLYTCYNQKTNETVVYRLYGKVDMCRSEEILLSRILGDKGLSPQIKADWENGRIEQFLPAKNLKLHEQWEPDTMRSIAQKLARLHQTEIPIDKKPTILQRIRDLVDKCNHSGVDLTQYKPFIKIVEDFLLTTNAEIGFCHNDLHEGNILRNTFDKSINFIDYEYAAYNYISYDIANHFCEWMFDYDVEKDPYFTYLPSNWPSDKTIALFLFLYYDAKKLDKSFLTDKINEIKQFALVSHVTWALWSLSMGETNINFGYLEFAQARIDAFQRLVNSKSKSRRASTNG